LRAVAVKPERSYQSFSEMKFDLEHPARVRPFIDTSAPLLERNPVLFYKVAFALSLALNIYLLFRLISGR
jgi:hypothetical protein